MNWWLRYLKCPLCGSGLRVTLPVLRCRRCGPYPVLAGVPVLVPQPYAYCGAYRESILATLAEFDEADALTVDVVRTFAGEQPATERFSDDWTAHEAQGEPAPQLASDALESLLHAPGPREWLLEQLSEKTGVLVELGCGAGELSVALAQRTRALVVSDLSLRAVLHARRRATGVQRLLGVVADAHALPFTQLDALVAENVVDLLDEPHEFFASAATAVKRGGRLLVATPEPEALTPGREWKVTAQTDALPWLRLNSPRFVEVYFVKTVAYVRFR